MPRESIQRAVTCTVISLLPCSCGPGYAAPPATPQLARISKTPFPELQRGHDIHQAKCAKCHPFENPADHDVVELREEILPVMARKSKLDHADEKAVIDYLLAARMLH